MITNILPLPQLSIKFPIYILIGYNVLLCTAQTPKFEFHYIEENPKWLTSAMQCTLSDIDNDGDLDWTVGNVNRNPSLFWYEYKGPDDWVQHVVGSDDGFFGGAASLDVNYDGMTDLISGEYLFIQKRRKKGEPIGIGWDKYFIGTGDSFCHDMIKADMNNDGKMDILTNSGNAKEGIEGLCWYKAPKDATKPWTKYDIGGKQYRVHGGIHPNGVGDLDGDGDLDVAAPHVWFENSNGKATRWKEHRHNLIGQIGPWGIGTKTHVIDLDGDGDMDIVQSESDLREKKAGLGWLENIDGKGNFQLHWIHPRQALEDFHSLYVFDYDNDGDLDILVGNGPMSKGKQTFIYENISKLGAKIEWKRHTVLEGFVSHEALVGDVDADGDLDIISKEWRSGSLYYLENKLK